MGIEGVELIELYSNFHCLRKIELLYSRADRIFSR